MSCGVSVITALILAHLVGTAAAQTGQSQPDEWDKIVEAAKNEGKVVVSIPPSRKLRRGMEVAFTRRYGIGVEFVSARSSASIQKIISETKAGIQYVDLHIGGTESAVTGLLAEKALEPVEPYFLLPEVKDPKQWWGGHIWVDNAKRFIYAFAAYQTVSLWCNPNEYKPAEFQSFDDLLNPKLRGKIGISDPRTLGSGNSMWSHMLSVKDEEYLKKLGCAEAFCRPGSPLAGRESKQRETRGRVGHRLFRAAAFYQGRLAGRAAPLSEGGPLHHRRQRPFDGHQKPASSQRGQGVRQLALGKGRPRAFRPDHGRRQPASRRRHELAQRVRRDRIEGLAHRRAVSPARKRLRRKILQAQGAGRRRGAQAIGLLMGGTIAPVSAFTPSS